MGNPVLLPSGQPVVDGLQKHFSWAVSVIRRGKAIVVACLLLGLAPTILYLWHAERRYTAAAEVVIEGPDTGDSLLERSYGSVRLNEYLARTEVDILASTSMAEKVVAKLQLDHDPEFNSDLRPKSPLANFVAAVNPLPFLTGAAQTVNDLSPDGKRKTQAAAVLRQFSKGLSVKLRRRSYVIDILYTANSAEKAAQIANTLADLYVLDRLDASLQESRQVNAWLNERLQALRTDVNVAERAAEQYRISHNLGVRSKSDRPGPTSADQQMTELSSRLALARAELAQKRARLEQLRRISMSRGSYDTIDVLQSSLIQRLREQEVVRQRELSEALKTYGERHPRIIGFKADLAELQTKIQVEIEKIASALASDVEASQAGVGRLEGEIGLIKGNVDALGRAGIEMNELERQAETSRTLYESLLTRFKQDSEKDRIRRANARVLSIAPIPGRPSAPKSLRLLAIMTVLSTGFGIALVFTLDRLNNRIRSTDEGERVTGRPVLSVIPRWRQGKRKDQGAILHPVIDEPRSALADSFRALRAVLAAIAGDAGRRVILVTSSVPQEGKSFISRNLATVCAAAGQKVLLVDADLMRPQQHVVLGVSPAAGLTQALTGSGVAPRSLILRDERGGFDLMPAGPVDSGSGYALSSARIGEVLAALVEGYDMVVIDAPPALAATDAQHLATLADHVLYVVKWNDTKRDLVSLGLSMLGKVGANVAGLVLSQAQARRADSYAAYSYYGSYYGQGRKEKAVKGRA